MLSIIAQGTAHPIPSYVPWIILLPALAGLIQNFVGKKLPRQGDWLVIGAMFGALALSVMTTIAWLKLPAGDYFRSSTNWFELAQGVKFDVGLMVDGLTSALLIVVTLVASLVFLFSSGYMKGDPYYNRFFFWLSFFGVAMLILTLADNLMLLFVGWELVGLCSYKLIGFWSQDLDNAEAAKKAFIVTRVGDVGMLLGMLVIYWKVGSFAFDDIFAAVADGTLSGTLLTWAGLGLFFGAVGKSAQFPLHVWLPDAMAGPTPVSALIHAATMVAAGVYLSARVFPLFTPDALNAIAWTGGITALLGATIAFTQTDIKKVLAYSTVSQLGYMIMGVGVGSPNAAMFHLTTHAFFKGCLFLGSGSVIYAMHHAQDLKDMGGLRKKMPVTFWTFVISTLALAGIMFFSGFYSKDAILLAAFNNGFPVLGALGFGAAFMTAFYMTRMVWLCFFGEPKNQEKYDHAHESPWNMTVPLVVLAALSIGIIYTATHFSDRFFATPAVYASFPDTPEVLGTYAAPGEQLAHGHHPWWFTGLAIVLGPLGLLVGWLLFRSGKRDEKTPILPGQLHGLAKAKFYMDEMYLDGVVAGANAASDASNWVDANIVDGLVNTSGRSGVAVSDVSGDFDQVVVDGAVNLSADAAEGAGATLSAGQTGRIRNYVAAALGITAVVVALLLIL
jgi:NADH-quinone oxidoreductase subunit L